MIVAIEKVTDLDADLAKALAPFDENMEVESYREYETATTPKDHWVYDSLKRYAEHYENGTGVYPYVPNTIDRIRADGKVSDKPEDAQRAEIEKNALIFNSLPAEPGWADIYDVIVAWFGDEADQKYDPETDRLYSDSTYNPESKWDWWVIGGRWSGYFNVAQGANRAELINGDGSAFGTRNTNVMKCDGGTKRNLDLDAMRDEKGAEVGIAYDTYHELVDHLPEANSWKYFCSRVDAQPGYTFTQARRDYGAQARVRVVKDTEFDAFMGPDAIEEYAKPRKLLVEQARARAVPGYAVLTHEGKWMAPGDMGWFGMSSESESETMGYLEVANAYLDSLSDDTWLVQVDCHI